MHLGVKTPKYTDCLVTMYSNEGTVLPTMLFTYNPAFNFLVSASHSRPRRRARQLIREWGIDPAQVVYLTPARRKSPTYCRESRWIIRTYLEYHSAHLSSEDWFLHDEGGAFGKDSSNVFDELGSPHHQAYPPPVHQYLSVNDNFIHGLVKTIWRKSEAYEEDSVPASLFLKILLDSVEEETVRSCFERNFSFFERNFRQAPDQSLSPVHSTF